MPWLVCDHAGDEPDTRACATRASWRGRSSGGSCPRNGSRSWAASTRPPKSSMTEVTRVPAACWVLFACSAMTPTMTVPPADLVGAQSLRYHHAGVYLRARDCLVERADVAVGDRPPVPSCG